MNALSAAMALLSPPGKRARLAILIFHRVLPSRDDLFPEDPDAARFGEMLDWIGSWLNVMPLDEAVRRLTEGTLPARAAAITFDDGYADNHSVALPILRRHGLTATFFITTGFLDGGCMWNDRISASVRHCTRSMLDLDEIGFGRHALSSTEERRKAIDVLLGRTKYLPIAERDIVATRVAEIAGVATPTDLMMTTFQVRALRDAGMQIGAHTVSHPILAGLPRQDVHREVSASKASLENTLQEPIELFAYPNGKPNVDYHPEHTVMVRELGFSAAVCTGWGTAGRKTDVMQLPRFTPWDHTRGRFGVRLLGNLFRTPVAA